MYLPFLHLGRLRQKDPRFKSSLGDLVSPCHKLMEDWGSGSSTGSLVSDPCREDTAWLGQRVLSPSIWLSVRPCYQPGNTVLTGRA